MHQKGIRLNRQFLVKESHIEKLRTFDKTVFIVMEAKEEQLLGQKEICVSGTDT